MNPRHLSLVAAVAFLLATASAQTVPPQPVNTVSPDYPDSLVDSGIEGQAVVTFTITAEGDVANPVVSKADQPAFGEAALAVLPSWKFKPATKDGVAVPMKVSLPFMFRTTDEQKFNAALKRKVFMVLPEKVLSLEEYGGEAPIATRGPSPIYPKSLAGSGKTAEVDISLVVGPDGRTHNPEVISEDIEAPFAAAALINAAQTIFEPPATAGRSVYVQVTYRVKFAEALKIELRPEEVGKNDNGGGQ